MTVTYSDRSFLRLLFRWRGSIWKAVYEPALAFLSIYFVINLTYRFALNDAQQKTFEMTVYFISHWTGKMPIQFLLGFYVSFVVGRWWNQFSCISWPDKFLIFVTGNLPGSDESSRIMRRTFARYCNLLSVLVWREVSIKIKKRFPRDEYLVKYGLMTESEMEVYQKTTSMHGRWFLPVSWMLNLLTRCHQEGRFGDIAFQKLIEELYSFRGGFGMLTVFDWVNAPLVYTQVVTIATYGYFLFCVVGRQSVIVREKVVSGFEIDIYFPVFTMLELLFYIGWLKVGEQYRCPFGEDDDDFDMNYILDRNVVVGNMLVDELAAQEPTLEKDVFWGHLCPELPHTRASVKVRDRIPNWRLYKLKLNADDQEILNDTLESVESPPVEQPNNGVKLAGPGAVPIVDQTAPLIPMVEIKEA